MNWSMDLKTHKSIVKHYTELYKKFGPSPASVGWTKGRQDIRFNTITEIGIVKNSSILDVGCGFGDLSAFLKKRKLQVKYTGIDINQKFVELAKKKYPKVVFETRDIENNPFKKKFDWVFAIGSTNQSGSYKYIERLLTEMFRCCKKGIAMDFLSTYVDFKKPQNFHASPEKVFQIAKRISKRVVIRHDYFPFEFCVYIYKNDKITKNLSFKSF